MVTSKGFFINFMKRYVVIRDDDISYFTQTAMLELLYRPLFKRGIPVNFCVIPKVLANIPIGAGQESPFFKQYGLRYEPFIPASFRGQDKSYDIRDNPELISFISGSPVDIVQHGFNHSWSGEAEFACSNERIIKQNLENGRQILQSAFGKKPEFFCPPWDQISQTGIYAVKRAGFLGISLSRFGRYLPFCLWPAYFWNKHVSHKETIRWKRLLLIRHPGCFISLFSSPQEVFARFKEAYNLRRIIVLVNHHWEYNFDGRIQMDAERLRLWHSIIDFIINQPETEIISFGKLYKHIIR